MTTDLTCNACGLTQASAPLRPGEKALCRRCEAPLAVGSRFGEDAILAFALSGLILFFPAVLLPLVGADELGNRRVSLLLTGAEALWVKEQMHWLSFLILLCGLVLPFALLLGLVGLHGPERLTRRWIDRPTLARVAKVLGTWAFPEVQVLAVIVGVVKLNSLVHLEIGPGFWCYCGMAASLLLARHGFETSPSDPAEELATSTMLGWKSRAHCVALAAAAIVLLAPANLLPVLRTVTSGDDRTDTIYSGVVELTHQGLWGLAAIVFTASIVIPGLKLTGLACLIFQTNRSHTRSRTLTRLYSGLVFIGRWSMLDVFLAGFLVGLIEFGEYATVEAQIGLIAFSAVVVLTVLATESFDPREIWDPPAKPLPL